jgi:hypothetical protein
MNSKLTPCLTSTSGVTLPASYHVFFQNEANLAAELSRFMKEKTGLSLTFILNGAEDDNELSAHIKEENDTTQTPDGKEVTVAELLDEVFDYTLTTEGEYRFARDLVLELFDLHQDHLSHLQYFEDEGEGVVRMSVAAQAFISDNSEPTIGGSYIARRAVSNLGYFILKAADHNFDLNDHDVESDPLDVYSALTEWMTDVETRTTKGDPALEAMEALLTEELTEGEYLKHGRESFLESLKGVLSSQNNTLIFPNLFALIVRCVTTAEVNRRARDVKGLF